jgi:signal transduction histidine kinase
MTDEFLLDWAVMAVSLFNTILLLWLGSTVLLNAERRFWGIWLAGGGLLLGGAFFVSHSAILGIGIKVVDRGMDFWWHLGWVPVIALPFAWYVVMLWYAGFWDDTRTALHRRQRPWLVVAACLTLATVALTVFANPLPSYWRVVGLDLQSTLSIRGIPLLVLVYPLYSLLCMALALDVLRRPGPTGRVMGDLARRRARPWLAATSFVLVLASLLVGGAILWIVLNARERQLYDVSMAGMIGTVAWLDLAISSLIAVAIVLLGQAVVSYEIFTGKALPRRGLLWQWRNAVVLAGGYGALVSLALTLNVRPVYTLLVTAGLMTLFFALYSWSAYAERAQYIGHLRPFVASQRLYDYLLAPGASSPEREITAPFNALCGDVLGVRVAYLAALGPLSPLVGSPLAYPGGHVAALPPLGEITGDFRSQQAMCVPVDPTRYGGAIWAVPLWGERGLIGVMFLGDKRNGGLFTEEEIEIARASGERLIDAQAGIEMAQRLMTLQRRRMAESGVLDRRTRRVLHDDVLPQLHTALLALSGQTTEGAVAPTPKSKIQNPKPKIRPASDEVLHLLADAHRQISDLLREMPSPAAPDVSRLGLVGALRRVADEELTGAFDSLAWDVEPDATQHIADMPALPAEVIFYAAREAMRNAARYARDVASSRPLHLRVSVAWRGGLELLVEDDGVGISSRLIPGAGNGGNGSEDKGAGGSGQGLALHSTLMAVVGGSLATESVPGRYTRVLLSLPEESWY